MSQSILLMSKLIERIDGLQDTIFGKDLDLDDKPEQSHDEILKASLDRVQQAMGPLFQSLDFDQGSQKFNAELSMEQMSFLVGHLMDTLLLVSDGAKVLLERYEIVHQANQKVEEIVKDYHDDDSLVLSDLVINDDDEYLNDVIHSSLEKALVDDQGKVLDLITCLAVDHALLSRRNQHLISLAHDIFESSIGGRKNLSTPPQVVEKIRINEKVTQLEFSNLKSTNPACDKKALIKA